MAGDWLKMTHALPEKPEVLAIAGRTGLNRFEVVGRLFILWRWFDNNTVDGNAVGVTSVTLNECLFGYGVDTNFVSAVIAAEWLVESDAGISVVKFDEHTSESAKQRAQTAKRVAKSKKNAKGNAHDGDQVTHGALPNALPREEKRREEKEHQPAALPGFDRFWSAWPKNLRKEAKGKCQDAWVKAKAEPIAEQVLAHIEAKKLTDWTKDGGQFVEAPLVYLNQRRWEGAESSEQTGDRIGSFI